MQNPNDSNDFFACPKCGKMIPILNGEGYVGLNGNGNVETLIPVECEPPEGCGWNGKRNLTPRTKIHRFAEHEHAGPVAGGGE
jgi:hypothetical protein